MYQTTLNVRQRLNLELLKNLEAIILSSPNIRFGQAVSMFFKNKTNERYTEFENLIYNEEPAVTLARYKKEAQC